jgi:hypothetical protein
MFGKAGGQIGNRRLMAVATTVFAESSGQIVRRPGVEVAT